MSQFGLKERTNALFQACRCCIINLAEDKLMDAAHKLIKATCFLLAIAFLLAAPGWAQTPTLVVTTSVTLSGTGGQNVNVTSSATPTTEITYAIGNPPYSNDNNRVPINWLRVTGETTTPALLSFNLFQTSGLIQGTHTA